MKKNLNSLLHNKIVLYVLFVVALVNLMSYLGQNNLYAVILFLAIGVCATHYTKNMVIVLLVAIVATNLLVRGGLLKLFGLREGNTNIGSEVKKLTEELKNEKDPKKKAALIRKIMIMTDKAKSDSHSTDGAQDSSQKKLKDGVKGLDGAGGPEGAGELKANKGKGNGSTHGAGKPKGNSDAPAALVDEMKSIKKDHQKTSALLDDLNPLIKQAEGMLSKIHGKRK